MSQSQKFNTSNLSLTLQGIKYNKVGNTSVYEDSTGLLKALGIVGMFQQLKLNYENDYFTSAWQSPNAPLNATESVTGITVPRSTNTLVPDTVSQNSENTRLVTVADSSSSVAISQRALDFLKSFDDWVRRNNYSGSRAVQQVYSRFGIKTDDYRSHYAQVITTDSMPIQVGDITQTSEGSQDALGSYAGKGIMNGGKAFNIECSDYGILIVLGYFTVTPMNPYGFHRMVLRSTPLDYYNPEFDGLGADAIPVMEYYENPLGLTITDTTDSDAVFGFTERYNSYRYGRDMITGEFRDYRNDGIMNVWHTGRNLGAVRKAGNLVAQSSSVNTMENHDSQYNRIFSVTNDSVNHFYLTAQFAVNAYRPMLNLNQVPKLGEGDTVVPRNGNVIS